MKFSAESLVMAFSLAAIGLAIGAAGIYIAETDDAPGAALIAISLMISLLFFAVALGARTIRRKP